MFLHFYAFEHVNVRNQPGFLMVWSELEKYHLGEGESSNQVNKS